jgi:hypothetical protein
MSDTTGNPLSKLRISWLREKPAVVLIVHGRWVGTWILVRPLPVSLLPQVYKYK